MVNRVERSVRAGGSWKFRVRSLGLAFVLALSCLASRTLRAQNPVCEMAEILVGTATGIPGQVVEVEVRGGVSCEVSGFIAAIGHDRSKLRFVQAVPGVFVSDYAGEDLVFRVTNANDNGYAVVGAIFDFSIPLTVPAVVIEKDTVLARLTYEIMPDAAAGVVELLNRTQTFGENSLVANVFSGSRGEFSIQPALGDGSVTVEAAALFDRGDANGDASLDLSDASFGLNFLFSGGDAPGCMKAADANDDGDVDLSDALFVLNFLFNGGDALPPPFRECGTDSTSDALSCDALTCP